jgi:hypothetical protein
MRVSARMPDEVQIPSQAVSPDGADLRAPVRDMLEGLMLLGSDKDMQDAAGMKALFTGPPQSVALIEAGATAASKWWATGLGATAAGLWAIVGTWYDTQPERVQMVILGGTAVVTAALVLALGYLIASDVRGRALASIGVIEARAKVATTMVEAARRVYAPPADSTPPELIPLPKALRARNQRVAAANQDDWLAVAIERRADGTTNYLLVKDSTEASLPASAVEFITT